MGENRTGVLGAIQAFCDESDPRVRKLSERMAEFYARVRGYDAYQQPSHLPEYWKPVLARIHEHVAAGRQCRVLEFGAGRTGFAAFLGDLRSKVAFDVQDISTQNLDYLRTQADNLHACDIRAIAKTYDVIFSTFAWEHVTEPRAILQHLLECLHAGGTLFIACPRYDFPFYLSPSARRLPRAERVRIAIWLMWRRTQTFLLGRAAFLLHTEPAALHGPWFIDADAVHWVSLWDLRSSLPAGYEVKRLRVPATGLRGRFWEKYLLMFVEVRKTSISGRSE